jgi:hypothetical protein
MGGEWSGWQPDPFGAHEFRFFANDGRPTLLVRDGGTSAYDPPPPSLDHPYLGRAEFEAELESDFRTTTQPTRAPAELSREVPRTSTSTVLVVPEHRSTPRADAVPPPSRLVKILYAIILTAMAVSVIALAVRHFTGSSGQPGNGSAVAPTRASTGSTHPSTTTTVALPASLKPSAAASAAALIASWASGNRAEALSVATAPAVSTLFTAHYSSGLVIDRGCSVAFSPIVCTYGPPGGASPTDPIFEIYSVQTPGGWYVSSATIEN